MNVLPVLDVRLGQVVRGVAGRRDEYRPVESRLATSTEPLAIARALRDQFGFTTLYVADLDAILERRLSPELYRSLTTEGFHLWLDAGVREAEDVVRMPGVTPVAGLETIAGPHVLADDMIFSLDLKLGQPLTSNPAWPRDPFDIAAMAVAAGVKRLLVLDLAGVGMGHGVATTALCQRLRSAYPDLELTTGGGVRGADDLVSLGRLGIDHVLVASALHDGRLTPDGPWKT